MVRLCRLPTQPTCRPPTADLPWRAAHLLVRRHLDAPTHLALLRTCHATAHAVVQHLTGLRPLHVRRHASLRDLCTHPFKQTHPTQHALPRLPLLPAPTAFMLSHWAPADVHLDLAVRRRITCAP